MSIIVGSCIRARQKILVISIAAAASLSAQVNAQEQLEEISVTGSRIRLTSGMATPTPVTVVTRDEMTALNPGASAVEQLATLPQFFGTQSSQRGSGTLFGAAGGSYLNMRNLGANRTLILLDGSRLPPADKRGSVNVDMLPTALMRSVDTVTGGASAAYGADALGGVVNFVLDREFEGLRVNTGAGLAEWGDGQRYNFEIAGGKALTDKLNVIGSFNSNEIAQIARLHQEVQGKSSWFQNWGHVTNPAWISAAATPGVPQRITVPCVSPTNRAPSGMIYSRVGDNAAPTARKTSFAFNDMVFTDDGQGVREFQRAPYYADPARSASTATMGGDCTNPEYLEYAQSRNAVTGHEVANRAAFVGAQYKFTDNFSGFVQALAGRSESRTTNVLGGMNFVGGWHGKVFRDNPFLPDIVAQAMDDANVDVIQVWKSETRRDPNALGFGVEESGVFTSKSFAVGFDWTLPNGWDMRASWQRGDSHRRTGIFNDQRVDRTYLALDAVRHPVTGQTICNVQRFNPTPAQLAATPAVQGRIASPGGVPGGTSGNITNAPLASPIGLDFGTVENCVPLNIMGVSQHDLAAKNYINTPKVGDGVVDQDFAEVLMTGEIYEGWGYGPVSFAAGFTYRDQSFYDRALPSSIDVLGPPLNAPELGIRGIPPGYTAGSANLHARSTIPDVSGGYDVWEWFGELTSTIWESRSGQQRLGGSFAARQSFYSNLDSSLDSWKLGIDLQIIEDLRLRFTRSRDIREATFSERFDTQSSGANIIDPFQNGAFYQTTITSGGNPGLSPEAANTNVIGLVYQPSWLSGMSLSADWYDVKVSGSIAQLGVQRIIDDCFAGNQALCGQIQRDAGQIARVFDVFLNVAQARVRGIDYELAYRTEPNFFNGESETLNFRLLAGFVAERSDTPLGRPQFDISGWLGTPDLTGIATATYGVGPYSFQLQQRYIAGVGLNRLWREGIEVDRNTVSSGNFTNFRFGYNGEFRNGSTWGVNLDVTNLFDRGPPLVAGANQGTPFDYDIFGRRYFVSVRMNF
jgi:iron complex outermembrane recepter protein